MRSYLIVFLAGAVLFGSSTLWAGVPKVMSLRVAVERALAKNPLILDAGEKIHASEASMGLSLAPALPQVVLNGSANSKKDPLNLANPAFGGEPYNSYDVNLKVTQSIYAGGATLSAYSDAQKEKRIRTLDRGIVERGLVLNVIQTYHSILLGQRKVGTLERTRSLQQELLATARKNRGIGRAQTLDVLQIQTQLALIEPKIIQAKNLVSANAAELALLLSEGDAKEFILPEGLNEVDALPLLQKTKGPLLEIERAGVLRDQGLDRKGMSLAKYSPRLDAVALWGRGAFVKTDLLDEYSTYWSVGLQFSFPVFSGLASIYERRSLESQVVQLDSNESRVLDERTLEQIRARQNLEASRIISLSSRTAYEFSEKALMEAQANYRLATIEFSQFLSVQQSALEAEVAFDQAKLDAILAAAQYCATTGIPLNELINLLETHS